MNDFKLLDDIFLYIFACLIIVAGSRPSLLSDPDPANLREKMYNTDPDPGAQKSGSGSATQIFTLLIDIQTFTRSIF